MFSWTYILVDRGDKEQDNEFKKHVQERPLENTFPFRLER